MQRLLLVCWLSLAHGFAPAAQMPLVKSAARSASAVKMHLPIADALPLHAAPLDALVPSLPSAMLVSDAVGDFSGALSGFAGSPLILLLPIGAGTLIASIIIFILVKAAG